MTVDRKQQMKEITERLEQGIKDIFTSEMYTTYLRTMAKFHNYSFNNTLLIAMQRPDATLVAGFNAWKEQERSSTKKSVLDALHSLKAKKQEQPAQEQDKPKKAKTKGMEL